ncbi:shikimate kinase [Microbacterium sp. NIBRBAC000506063]|uniref:shikimate kinase n=1 Tax=Microbacterium sp. NIBRBAC000506063 TaxID=2734618 RepID=UPI001CB74821|nr:shikimate kinase [Microbacterium sp. NIBRBAC000506063]
MAAGKTSVGRTVAKLLGVPFRDSDKRIAALHGPIPEIFAEHGEARFREIERETIAEMLEAEGVLSLGGGAVIDPATRDRLAAVPVAFLTVSAQAVAPRITGGSRPLLAGEEDPLERWSRIFEERRAWYEEVADATFDTSRMPMQRVAQNIANWLEETSA